MPANLKLRHVFVESFPDQLDSGTLYVSVMFASAAHLCCCGCGRQVVTPITPTDWKLIFDGDTVSLFPSIGNWSFPCRSHYWIRADEVVWAARWSESQVKRGREQDAEAKKRFFGDPSTRAPRPSAADSASQPADDSLSEWLRDLYG